MKLASRSGFIVFLGGIFAARNVAHVRASFTLPSLFQSTTTDISSRLPADLQPAHFAMLTPWSSVRPITEFGFGKDIWS
jgi:hypothetical protein